MTRRQGATSCCWCCVVVCRVVVRSSERHKRWQTCPWHPTRSLKTLFLSRKEKRTSGEKCQIDNMNTGLAFCKCPARKITQLVFWSCDIFSHKITTQSLSWQVISYQIELCPLLWRLASWSSPNQSMFLVSLWVVKLEQRVASSLWHCQVFWVINVKCSGPDRFTLRVPLFSVYVPDFQSHTTGKFDCK